MSSPTSSQKHAAFKSPSTSRKLGGKSVGESRLIAEAEAVLKAAQTISPSGFDFYDKSHSPLSNKLSSPGGSAESSPAASREGSPARSVEETLVVNSLTEELLPEDKEDKKEDEGGVKKNLMPALLQDDEDTKGKEGGVIDHGTVALVDDGSQEKSSQEKELKGPPNSPASEESATKKAKTSHSPPRDEVTPPEQEKKVTFNMALNSTFRQSAENPGVIEIEESQEPPPTQESQ